MAHKRITWKSVENQGQRGYIVRTAHGVSAQSHLFTIRFSLRPADHTNGTPWIIEHRLPFQKVDRNFPTVKAAQEYSERFLLICQELLGFQPIPERVEIRYKEKQYNGNEKRYLIAQTPTLYVISVELNDTVTNEFTVGSDEYLEDFELVPARG